MRYLLGTLAVLALSTSAALARTEEADPQVRLGLGRGYDPEHPTSSFLDCFEHDGITPEAGTASGVEFETRLVTSREQVHQMMGVSVAASGRYLFAKGSAAVDYGNDFSFASDSVVWAVWARQDFGDYKVDNIRLRDAYKNLDLAELKRKCGSEVVTRQHREGRLVLLYQVDSASSERIKTLSAEFSAGAATPTFDVEVKTKYSQFTRAAQMVSTVKTKFIANGGAGMSGLGQFATSIGDLEKTQAALSQYLSAFTGDKAAAITSDLTPIEAFTTTPTPADFFRSSDTMIRQAYLDYMDAASLRDRLVTFKKNNAGVCGVPADDSGAIKDAIGGLKDYLSSVRTLAKACLDSGACDENTLPDSPDLTSLSDAMPPFPVVILNGGPGGPVDSTSVNADPNATKLQIRVSTTIMGRKGFDNTCVSAKVTYGAATKSIPLQKVVTQPINLWFNPAYAPDNINTIQKLIGAILRVAGAKDESEFEGMDPFQILSVSRGSVYVEFPPAEADSEAKLVVSDAFGRRVELPLGTFPPYRFPVYDVFPMW